ncbi:ABC transporter transmembrane domain-containing protein, partial [Streptomyces goshikiensis]
MADQTAGTVRPARGHDTSRTAPAPVRLRHELGAEPGRLSAAILFALVATAATLALPLFVQEVITDLSGSRPPRAHVVMMCAAAVGGAVTQALSGFLLARVGERLACRVRIRIMEYSLRLPLGVVKAQGTGDLAARVTSDALLLRQVVDIATQLPLAALTVAATLAVMVWIDWVLTLVTVGALAVLTVLILLILRRMKDNVSGQQVAIGQIAQRFTANLDALTTIKAYRAEALAAGALAADAERLRAVSLEGARLGAMIPAVLSLGNQFAMIAVILTGGARLAAGDLSIAAFTAFLLYLLQTCHIYTTP